MKNLLLLLLTYALLIPSLQATEIKGKPEELRAFLHPEKQEVSLSANAERRVYADQAIVSVVVKNEAKTLSAAMQDNSTLRASLKESLIALGIDAENIQNSKFSSSPQYGWFGDKPKSFEVLNRVAIKISDEKSLQAVADITDKFPEMSIAGTEFKHTQKEAVHRELKKEALDKILVDKRYYEENLGVTLKTASFYDSGLKSNATLGEQELEVIQVSGMRLYREEQSRGYSSELAAPPQVQSSFEEIVYTTSISVEYTIE